MFVTVSQGYKAPTNYSLQMLWLVTWAFCLASSLAFVLSRYVLDTPNESSLETVTLPSMPTDNAVVPHALEMLEVPSAVPSSVTSPVPVLPPSIPAKPAEPNTVVTAIQRVPSKPKPLVFKATQPVTPRLAPKPTLRAKSVKVQVQKKIAHQPAKQAKSPTLKHRAATPTLMQPDFKTLEQSLGVDL
jgi:hypothetical protein